MLRQMTPAVVRIGLGLVVAYLGIVVLAWVFQERLAFPAPRATVPDPGRAGFRNGERIALVMKDGTPLVGWFLPGSGGTGHGQPGLLWFYGNGENIGSIWPILREFQPRGAALLVVDYPGYGASGGRTTEAGLYEAADLAYAALRARPEVDPGRIFVYGRSLGSAAATYTGATHPVAGLILESPFTSARGMARVHYPFVPRFLLRLRLDNLAAIRRVHCPLLLFHGTADRLVPVAMGMELAAASAGPREVVLIQGADHNETYDIGGDYYREKLAAFVLKSP